MRMLIAVLALVATPVIASVAQDRGSTPPSGDNRGVRHSDVRSGDKDDAEECEKDAENSHRWQQGRHLGDKNDDKQCSSTGSTSGTGGTGATGGTPAVGSIGGFVFLDMAGTGVWAPSDPTVAGWAIQLTGPVTLSATSDMLGNYLFANVPAGTYSLCQVQPTTWLQTFPTGCYSVVLAAGAAVTGQNFGVVIH
jgi:hypothetical protein